MVYLVQNELISCLQACGLYSRSNYPHINEVFDVAVLTKQAKVLVKLNSRRNSLAKFGKHHLVLRVTPGVPAAVIAKNIKDMCAPTINPS